MKIQNRYEYDPNKDLLGRGGFARVYRAHDTLLHRDVALKVFSDTGGHRYSVLDEIRKAIGLEHPNLLRYYDVVLLESENHLGEKEQTQIGVMELANAGDLKQFARSNPGSPVLYKLLKEVLQGLEYLHGKGIIHRDLKAQNILLVKQDGRLTAKISDFGISKDMGSGGQSSSMMVGTVEYMAPEQFSPAKYGIDGKVSSNLDLWSFGIMVHELLTDSTPFGSRDGDTTVEQIMAQILSTELPQDIERLPEPYKSVVRKCLVANAKERIRKASELIGYFEGQGSATTPVQDDVTRTYPKASPAAPAPHDNDATKVYPKAGASGAASRPETDSTKVYAERPNTPEAAGQGPSRRKGVLLAAMAGLLLSAGVGTWYVGEQQARAQAEAKAAEEPEAAAKPEAVAAKTATDAKAATELQTAAGQQNEVDMVRIPYGKPFLLGKTEVTQKQWRAVMGGDPPELGKKFKGCDECAVSAVSWDDAKKFIAKLNAQTQGGYRLPTESEWKFACRAGTQQKYCGSDSVDEVAWHKGNGGDRVQPVGQKKANAWGLYDMSGNVSEWTEDKFDSNGYYPDRVRVIQGGSWDRATGFARAASRDEHAQPDWRDNSIGFRLARTLPESVATNGPNAKQQEPAKSQDKCPSCLSEQIHFDFDKVTLSPPAKAKVEELVRKAGGTSQPTNYTVVGHADGSGSADYAIKLSQRQADAARRYLIQLGVPAERITTEGRGNAQLLVPIGKCERLVEGEKAGCLAPNRRVELIARLPS